MNSIDLLQPRGAQPAAKTNASRQASNPAVNDRASAANADTSFGKTLADRRAAASDSHKQDQNQAPSHRHAATQSAASDQSNASGSQPQASTSANDKHAGTTDDRPAKSDRTTTQPTHDAPDGKTAAHAKDKDPTPTPDQAAIHVARRRLDLRGLTDTRQSQSGKPAESSSAGDARKTATSSAHTKHVAESAAGEQTAQTSLDSKKAAHDRGKDKPRNADHKTDHGVPTPQDTAAISAAVANIQAPQHPATAKAANAQNASHDKASTHAPHGRAASHNPAALAAQAAMSTAKEQIAAKTDAAANASQSAAFQTLVATATDKPQSGHNLTATDGTSSAFGHLLGTITPGHSAAASTPAAATATAGVSAALNAPLGSDAWNVALGQQSLRLVHNADGQAQLILHPRDLGQIQVSLKMGDGSQAQLHFVSPHAHVREAVEAALPQLRQAFAAGGLTLGQASVGDQSPQQSFSQNTRDQDGSRRRGRTLTAIDDAPVAAQPRITTLTGRSAAGGIDIFA